jgi:hypothetical protein
MTVPARFGALILVARVGTADEASASGGGASVGVVSAGGARRALSTVGTTFTTGVAVLTTGATTGAATLNTGESIFTTGLVTAPKRPLRGSREFAVVDTAVGIDVVGRTKLDAGTTPRDEA